MWKVEIVVFMSYHTTSPFSYALVSGRQAADSQETFFSLVYDLIMKNYYQLDENTGRDSGTKDV